MSNLPRQFSDEEMAVILKRAAALQDARASTAHSLAEIQEIAAQVGIDPALVAHVAQSPAFSGRKRRGLLASPASNTYEERRIAVPVKVKDYGLVLDAIRRVARTQGEAKQVFDSLEWRTGSDRDAEWFAVTATGRPDATHLRVEGDFGVAVALMHIVGLPAALILSGVAFSQSLPLPVEIAATAAGIGAVFGGIRYFWRRMLRRSESQVRALTEEIEKEIRQLGGGAPPAER